MDCKNCGTELKAGVFKTVAAISPSKIALLNEYSDRKWEAACSSCGNDEIDTARQKRLSEIGEVQNTLTSLLKFIPITSIHSPAGWDYDVRDLITAQSTTGTGVLSDFTSGFTDFFGAQSGSYNRKIKAGEELCKKHLRAEAIRAGGNAIVAVDLDYAEVGGSSAMLMVCMTGTAVRLRNPAILGEDATARFDEIVKAQARLNFIQRLAPAE